MTVYWVDDYMKGRGNLSGHTWAVTVCTEKEGKLLTGGDTAGGLKVSCMTSSKPEIL